MGLGLQVTMSVALVSNAYLDDTSAKIRSKPVPWEVRMTHYIRGLAYVLYRVISGQVWLHLKSC
jgi:hypothetical protein